MILNGLILTFEVLKDMHETVSLYFCRHQFYKAALPDDFGKVLDPEIKVNSKRALVLLKIWRKLS